MKKIFITILLLALVFTTGARIFGQTLDSQIKIDNAMSKDTVWVMLSDTNNASANYGRGMFYSWATLKSGLARYINGLDTAYVNSGDSLILVIAGDTTIFEGGSGSGISDGDKGDITVSGSGETWTVDNGLNAAKIADGTVSSAEFQRINTVTSNVQTQLNAKAASGANTDITSVILNNSGLGVHSVNPSYRLNIVPGDAYTANRSLIYVANDASRTVTMSGNLTVAANATVSGTNTGDQDLSSYSTDANVVHKTTNETVAGEKTLTDILRVHDPIITYNENLSNRFAIMETSHKNLTGSGYMAHRKMNFDSLAYPALNDPYGRFGEWLETTSWDSTSNAGFENGGNLIHSFGFNYDQSSPKYNPERPDFRWTVEQGYYPLTGNTLLVESHWEMHDTTGRLMRNPSAVLAYDGSYAAFDWTATQTHVRQAPDDIVGGGMWEEWNYLTGAHDIHYNSITSIYKKYTGSFLRKYSNIHTTPTWRNILTQDANDRLLVGDSTGIDIENRLTFRINSFATPLIKSNNYTLRIDTVLVDFLGIGSSRNITLSAPGDADKMLFGYDGSVFNIGKYAANEGIFKINQAAPDNSLFISSAGKIGLGVSPYSGITLLQQTNDLAGGIRLTESDQSAYSALYHTAANDLAIHTGGGERFYFKANGDISAVAYPNSRDDGTPTNFIGSDGSGNFTSYPKADMIAGLVSVSDTAAMLSHYIERQDTASMLTKYIDRASAETIYGVKTFNAAPIVPASAYAVGWNGSNEPPTKNDVYDKIETLSAGSGHTIRDDGVDETARTGLNFVSTSTINMIGNDDAGNNETEIAANVISGSIGDTELGSGLDATQLADGTVTSTEFQYINTLSSNAQTQLTGKATLAGVAGGQYVYGGTAANDDLILEGTSHATKTSSYISLQPSGGFVGIGTSTPDWPLVVSGGAAGIKVISSTTNTNIRLSDSSSSTAGTVGTRSGVGFFQGNTAPFRIEITGGSLSDMAMGGARIGANYGLIAAPTNGAIIEGRVGIANTAPDKALEVNLGTADAFRLNYNDNNGSAATYVDQTISSAGVVTQNAVGSASSFVFSDPFANTAASLTLGAAATTFALTSNVMTITGNGGGNTLATITAGFSGQILTLIFADALVTITDDAAGTANTINLSAAFTSTANDVVTLVHNGTSWREVSRSVN